MKNKLNKIHVDQKVFFAADLGKVCNDWADVSYQHDECPSISNGYSTIYFGTGDIDGGYPYIFASIECGPESIDLGFFDSIENAILACTIAEKNQVQS